MEEGTNVEWRQLGLVVDRVLFIASLIVMFWVSVWMLIKSAQTPHVHGVEHSGH